MPHEKVVGFCEPNKCKVEVAPKTETDALEERVTALEKGEFESINAGTITTTGDITVGGAINVNRFIPTYTLTTTQPSTYRRSFAGGSHASTRKSGSEVLFNSTIYSTLTSSSEIYSLFDYVVDGGIPISIWSARNQFVVTLSVGGVQVASVSNGSKSYTLSLDDLSKTIYVGCQISGSDWAAGQASFSYPTLYMY